MASYDSKTKNVFKGYKFFGITEIRDDESIVAFLLVHSSLLLGFFALKEVMR